MKLARIGLVIITSLVLACSFSYPIQAADDGDVDISATVPLIISDVSASSIGSYGATISWKTNGGATSQVFYDTEFHDNIVDYADNTVEDTALVSGHSVRLAGLSSSRTYHYRVRSAAVIDGSDFIAISEDYTFTTSSPAPPPPPPPPAPTIETNLFGEVASFRISNEGEILEPIEATSEDENLTMAIPEGTIALDKDSKRLTSLEAAVDETPPDPPEDAHIIGLAYDFGPDRATFDPPLTLEYTYDPEALPEGTAWLVLAYYDEETGEWVELPCTVNPVTHTITASVAHFTTFAIIGTVPPVPPPPPVPAAFTFSSLEVSPSELAPGEEVNISVLVSNTGGESGSYTVVLKINEVKEADERVRIAAGSSRTVSFTVTREEAGSYAVTVDGLSDSFTVVAVVPVVPVKPEPAAFSVSNLSIQPAEVSTGEEVRIEVAVTNTGGTEGSYTLVLKIDGVGGQQTVTIAAGDTLNLIFPVTRAEAGSYTVAVDGLSGSFTVVSVVEPPVEPPGVNWALVGGIIGGVLVVAALLIFFFLRRRVAY